MIKNLTVTKQEVGCSLKMPQAPVRSHFRAQLLFFLRGASFPLRIPMTHLFQVFVPGSPSQ